MLKKIGVQIYNVRDYLNNAEEIRETMKKLKAMGYDQAHLIAPKIGYAEYGKIASEEGIEIVGTHDNFDVMLNDPELAMENHRLLGTTNMGVGWRKLETLEQIQQFIKDANTVGANVNPHGFKFTYHNHSHEFRRVDGKLVMDYLVEGMDPETTSFVLDTYWVQHGGGDVRYWIEKLAGRVDILHLKDMGRDQDGPFITEIGNGNLYWDGIIRTALDCGVKYFIVEQDRCPGDPFDSCRISSEFLHKYFM